MDSIITTMAFLLANWNQERDYLANFEPFVLDRLKVWERDVPVQPKVLASRLSERFALPAIPLNTVTALRDRVHRDGYVKEGKDGRLYPNRRALEAVPELQPVHSEVLACFHAVTDGIRRFAHTNFDLTWTDVEVEGAVEQFLEEFSIEMAMARREGVLKPSEKVSRSAALTVVHGFARHAFERNRVMFDHLEKVVRGSMLTNVIYFRDLGSWTPKMERLTVYLDTTIAVRAIGLAQPGLVAAAQEMLAQLAELNRPTWVFEHTVEEMIGVLRSVERGLRFAWGGSSELKEMSRQTREVVDHLVQEGWEPADVERVISDIDAKLAAAGIQVAVVPDSTRYALREPEMRRVLEKYGWRRERQKIRDITSLSAIHQLREARPSRELGDTPALFVTSNEWLVRASAEFFQNAGFRSQIPQCMSDMSLTTHLWLRQEQDNPDVPRKVLIAESYAALNPSRQLWEAFLDEVVKARVRGDIGDQQVKALIYSVEAREHLFELTHGASTEVDAETPSALLERMRRPDVERVAQVRSAARNAEAAREVYEEAATGQARRLRQQRLALRDVEDANRDLREQNDGLRTKLETMERWRARVRKVGAVIGSCGIVAVGATAIALLHPQSVILLSAAVLTTIALGVLPIGWGWGGGLGRAWKVFLGIAAVAAFFGVIYDLLKPQSPATASGPAIQRHARRVH